MGANPYTDAGHVLIGGYFNLTLFGVTLTQAWIYFIRFRRDPRWMKIVVIILCAVDTANTLTLCVALYQWLIQRHDPGLILHSFQAEVQTSAVTAVTSQMVFAWRVQKLRRQWWLTAAICWFSLVGLVSLTVAISVCDPCAYVENLYMVRAPLLIWTASMAVCDLITAVSLYSVLRRSATGFGKTDNTIDRVKNLILQTCALTVAIDVTHLIIVAIHPNGMLHFMINEVVSKLYANGLLSTLTTRNSYQQLLGDEDESTLHIKDPESSTGWRGSQGRNHISVQLSLVPPARRILPQWKGGESALFRKEGTFRGPAHSAPVITTVRHTFTSSEYDSSTVKPEDVAGQSLAEDNKPLDVVPITSHPLHHDSANRTDRDRVSGQQK